MTSLLKNGLRRLHSYIPEYNPGIHDAVTVWVVNADMTPSRVAAILGRTRLVNSIPWTLCRRECKICQTRYSGIWCSNDNCRLSGTWGGLEREKCRWSYAYG